MTMSFHPEPTPIAPTQAESALNPTVLLQAEIELAEHDPWRWFSSHGPVPEEAVVWHEPAQDLTFAAIGCVAGRSFTGADRFNLANRWCSAVREHIITLPPHTPQPQTPLFMGGFSFGAGAPTGHGPWSGWPGGRVWVPRVLVIHQGGVTRAVFRERLRPGLDPRAWLERRARALAEPPAEPTPAPAPHEWTETDATARSTRYRQGVRAALESLAADRLHKLVLARDAAFVADPGAEFDPVQTVWRLRREYPGCTTFAFRRPDGATFLGATPELLVESQGGAARTVALAGTRRRGATPDEDSDLTAALENSAKDQHEHRLVVDALREALTPVARELRVPDAPSVRRLSKIQHLETTLNIDLAAEAGVLDLVRRLHPSPAVGGSPRNSALDWLTEHEGMDRGWYAGPVGWIDGALEGCFHVALRVAVLDGDRATAFAGAGLVVGSDPHAEWIETEQKLGAIRRALVATRENQP